MSADLDDAVARSAQIVRQRLQGRALPRTAVLLGSGWGGFAQAVEQPLDLPYAELPAFPALAIGGHALLERLEANPDANASSLAVHGGDGFGRSRCANRFESVCTALIARLVSTDWVLGRATCWVRSCSACSGWRR